MVGYCYFVWTLVFISLFHGGRSSFIVKNVHQLDEYAGVIISPKFGSRGHKIGYTRVDTKTSLFESYDVEIKNPSPQRTLPGLVMNLGYYNGLPYQLVKTAPLKFGGSTAGNEGDPTKYMYQVISVDKNNKSRRYGKPIKLSSVFYGYKSGHALGLKSDNSSMTSFGLKTTDLILTDIETRDETILENGVDKVGAVFHPTKNLIYYSVITDAGTTIYRTHYPAASPEVFASFPGVSIFISGFSGNEKFLLGFKWDEENLKCDAIAISVKTKILENIMTDDNQNVNGMFFATSGKKFAFVEYKDGKSKLFLGEYLTHPQ